MLNVQDFLRSLHHVNSKTDIECEEDYFFT